MNLSIANNLARGQYWKALRMALVAVWAVWALTASATTFSTSLDRDTMAVGDTAALSLTFTGGAPQGTPSLPDIPGLTITYAGPSTQTSFTFNGQTSQNTSTTTHQFTVSAQRPGVYTIPALTIQLDGALLSSAALKLTVTQPDSNSGSQVAFAKLVMAKKQMYVGEVTTAELQIWLRDDVQNFGNLQLPSLPADGFNVGKMTERARYRAQAGNRAYTVVPIAITLTAIKSGTLSLGPLTAQLVIVLPSSNQNGDPFFRMFNQGEQKQISLNTETDAIQGLKLPANAPPGFNGAIGKFKMTLSEGPTTVSAGDPITVRVKIEGQGALATVNLPDLSAWNGFKSYPPTTKTDYSDQQGLQGVKTFEQIVTPQNQDVKELPAFSFVYFDPDLQQYQTVSQPAMPITVHAAGAMPVPSVAAVKPASPENAAAQSDILPVKQKLGPLVSTGEPLLIKPAFLALQSLPVLAFLAALVWRRRTDQLANNPRLRRQRAVAQLVQAGVVDLRKYAAENKSDEFFATVFRLLQEQLGSCLDCPASAITESVVDDRLARLKAQPGTLTALRELFQSCNQARYAPVRDRQELAAIATKFETVTRELQALKA